MHKLIPFLLISGWLCSCSGTATEKEAVTEEVVVAGGRSFEVSLLGDDTLQFSYENGPEDLLVSNGQGSDFIVSPDSQRIAVNTRLFSNLTISRVYSRNPDGKFLIEEPLNLSSLVWDSIATKYQISVEDILYPKANAIRWVDGGDKIEVAVRGSTESGQKIDEIIIIQINIH